MCGSLCTSSATRDETGSHVSVVFVAAREKPVNAKYVSINPVIIDKITPASSDIGMSRGFTTMRRKNANDTANNTSKLKTSIINLRP